MIRKRPAQWPAAAWNCLTVIIVLSFISLVGYWMYWQVCALLSSIVAIMSAMDSPKPPAPPPEQLCVTEIIAKQTGVKIDISEFAS